MSNRSSGAIAARTAVAATAGGIAAELGGGKFSNGARTAAFVHLFNAEAARPRPDWEDMLVAKRQIESLKPRQYDEQMSPVGYTGGIVNADLSQLELIKELQNAHIDTLRELVVPSYSGVTGSTLSLTGHSIPRFFGSLLSAVGLLKYIPNSQQFRFHYECSGSDCNLKGFSVINE